MNLLGAPLGCALAFGRMVKSAIFFFPRVPHRPRPTTRKPKPARAGDTDAVAFGAPRLGYPMTPLRGF